MLLFLRGLRVPSHREKGRGCHTEKKGGAKQSPYYPAPSTERRNKIMGPQETTITVAAEEKGGSMLRRMILVLLVAALMAAVVALSALPTMAEVSPEKPGQNGGGPPTVSGSPLFKPGSRVITSRKGLALFMWGLISPARAPAGAANAAKGISKSTRQRARV